LIRRDTVIWILKDDGSVHDPYEASRQ